MVVKYGIIGIIKAPLLVNGTSNDWGLAGPTEPTGPQEYLRIGPRVQMVTLAERLSIHRRHRRMM